MERKPVVIAQEELENARATIPLVEQDSSLGYEPSMDYVTDRSHLEWKIRQLTSVLERDIPQYRKSIAIARSLEVRIIPRHYGILMISGKRFMVFSIHCSGVISPQRQRRNSSPKTDRAARMFLKSNWGRAFRMV